MRACIPTTYNVLRTRFVVMTTGPRQVTMQMIIKITCDLLEVTPAGLKSASRKWELCEARHLLALIVREYMPDTTYARIGISLGNRDHSTIVASVNEGNNRLATDKQFAAKFNMLKAEVERVRKWRGNSNG